MILIHRKPYEEFSEFLNVSLCDNILKLQLMGFGAAAPGEDVEDSESTEPEIAKNLISSIEINLKEIFVPYTRYKICFTRQNKFGEVFNFDEIQSSRDTHNTISFFYDLHPDKSFTLFLGKTFDDVLLLTSAYINDEQAIHIPITTFASEIICERYPEYKEKIELRDARREMLLKADPNNSLSYIEAQLDILTQIILELVKANPAVKKAVPGFEEFESVFASTNLFNIKPFEKCLGEIIKLKSEMRQIQKGYYNAKDTVNG